MEYAFRSTLTRFLLVFTVLALLAGTVWAQGTSEITGLVTDPQGAVVSDVQVTLTNAATGDKRTTTTSGAGIYRFPGLPIVGTYTLEVSPKGFKAVKVSGIVPSVGTAISQDVKLELGATSEQVTVEAGAEVVQTTESSLSQLVDRNIWQNAPLQVRNQNSFIELVAGAVPQDGTNNNRGASVNGAREGAGSYLVEGTDNNEQGQAGRGQISNYDKGGAATSISPDAIQEYRVITNSYSAEYGKGGGFVTDTVLKSGTNQFHGSAFEYNRIQALAANDFFSNRTEDPLHPGETLKDRLVRNQFGGSLGGPIIKDKTFFYGTGEFHRVRQVAPIGPATATTAQFLNYVQTGGLQRWAESSPNGICNNQGFWDANADYFGPHTAAPCVGSLPLSATVGPIFTQLLANPNLPYPLATDPSTFSTEGAGKWTSGLTYTDDDGNPVPVYGTVTLSDPQRQNEERFSIKMDHRFSERDSISGVYLYQTATFTDQYLNGQNVIGPQYTQDGRGQNVAITWNHTFTPTILNTFRASYLRHRNDFPSAPGTQGVPAYYTVDGMGVDMGNYGGSPQFFTDQQFQYLDTVSVVKGKHNFKFGGEYRRTRNASSFFNDVYSSVYPWGIEDTLTDLAFSDEVESFGTDGQHYYGGAYLMSAAVNPSTSTAPDVYRGYRANEVALFVQDDFRVTNRLTLNLGLRWEYFGPPHNFRPGIDSNVYFGSPVTPVPTVTDNPFFPVNSPFYASVATASIQVRDASIWNKDTNNWGPRFGFAYDVFGTQKIVVRGGFGIMYDRIYNNVFENIRFNPPFFSDNQVGWATGTGVAIGAVSSPGVLSFPFNSYAQFNSPEFAPLPNPRHMDQNIVTPYYEQAHLGLQWEFARGYVFEPEYVLTMGHKLTTLSDINTFNGRVSGAGDPARINPNIGADNFRANNASSNYHALQLSVRKAYSGGLSLNANFTYSKALDDVSDLFNNRAGARPTDNMHIGYDYGPADFDTRYRLVSTVSYELPFMKTNRWLGGWGTNAIISFQGGHPFTVYSSSSRYDANKDGYRTDRMVPIGNPADSLTGNNPADGYFDTTKWERFVCPASENDGFWCNPPIGRNSLYGPRGVNVDFNLTKRFKITENTGLTFQANFFNLFNHPNMLPPSTGANQSSATYGSSTATWGDNGGHRVTQLALRFDF